MSVSVKPTKAWAVYSGSHQLTVLADLLHIGAMTLQSPVLSTAWQSWQAYTILAGPVLLDVCRLKHAPSAAIPVPSTRREKALHTCSSLCRPHW